MGHKIPLVCVQSTSTSGTTFTPLLSCTTPNIAAEARAETPVMEAGTFSMLFVNVWDNSATGNTVFTLRKNGADGNMNIIIPAGVAGRFFDLDNSDHFASGDVGCVRMARSGGNVRATVCVYYETDSGKIVNRIGLFGQVSNTINAAAYTFPMQGQLGQSAVLNTDDWCPKITVPCVAKNFFASSYSNTANGSQTYFFRVNGSNTGMSITFPTMTSGVRSDTTSQVSINADDRINYYRPQGSGAGTTSLSLMGFDLEYPADSFQLFSFTTSGINTTSSGSRRWIFPIGSFIQGGSESLASCRLSGKGILSNWYIFSPSNAGSEPTTFNLRIASVDTPIAIVLPGAASGLHSDTSNSTTFDNEQYLSYSLLRTSDTGNLNLRWFAVQVDFEKVGGFTPQAIWF